MLTAWAKKIMAVMKNTGIVPHVTVASTSLAYIEAVSIGGNTRYIPPVPNIATTYGLINTALVETGSSSSMGVAFGSDNTEVTENDYTLGSLITGLTGLTPTIQTIYDSDNNLYIARLDYAISNNTGAVVTIREVGLFARFNTAGTRGDAASSSNRYSFMIDRTVLSSSVTIPDGEAATVRYDFAYQG